MGNLTNILNTFCFVIAVCVVETEAGSVVAKVNCDDRAVPIYIDGVNVGSTAGHREVWSGTVDETARVIAVDCENRPLGGALLVSFSNGFISDERWKCSGTGVSGWHDINFDDSDWETAYVIKTNKVGNGWPDKIYEIADDAKWIWRDNFRTSYSHSYCRAHIECGCEYKCDMMGDLTCFCPDGYSLNNDNRTCSDVDECNGTVNKHPLHDCGPNQRCINTPGSYECECLDGYEPIDDETRNCKDIDECADKTCICSATFECLNTIGSYDCVCPSGYYENTILSQCVDNDECNPQTIEIPRHQCEQTCNNTPGSYTCQCNPGFTLDGDGYGCSDIDECLTGAHSCSGLFKCQNTVGSHVCVCEPGYQKVEKGDDAMCVDDNECEQENGGCQHICNNTVGSHFCLCIESYVLQDDRRTCAENSANECTSISTGHIVSIILNVILFVALIVLVIIIVKRRNTVEGRERKRTQTHLELAGAMGPTELKRESQHAPSTDDAINTDYEKVDNAGPYESLAPTVQYANANVSPYEGTLQARVYCFDRPTVYADGVLKGNNTGTNYHWTGEVADDTKLLVVKCYNVDGDGGAGYCGFLAYIVDILASDTILSAWKCTDNITKADNDRWYDLDFDDSGWDVPRTSSSNYGGYRPTVKYGTVTQTDKVYVNTIPKPIRFLTTASSRPNVDLQAAYCRGNTGLVIYIQCERFCTVPIGSTSHSVFSPSSAWSYTLPRATRVFGVRGVRDSSDRPYIAILGSFGIKTSTEWRCINDSSLESEFGRGKPTDRNDSRWQIPVDQGPISLSEEIQGATPIWATGNDIVCVFDVECGCDYKCDVNGDDFKCLCPDGYVLNVDKRTCREVDECSEKNENLQLHDCDQRCINTPGGYECQCLDGYAPVDDKNRICNDIDECATQADICLNSFQCLNTNGSYRCVCPSGFHENTGKEECVDNDECYPQTIYFPRHQCEHTCTNTPGSYTCLCN